MEGGGGLRKAGKGFSLVKKMTWLFIYFQLYGKNQSFNYAFNENVLTSTVFGGTARLIPLLKYLFTSVTQRGGMTRHADDIMEPWHCILSRLSRSSSSPIISAENPQLIPYTLCFTFFHTLLQEPLPRSARLISDCITLYK